LPPEQVQAARLAFDARRWYASKVAPKRWADRIDLKTEVSGALQVDLQAVLLNPANLERLDEGEVLVLRNAVAKLCAPVIDGVAETAADVAASRAADAAATTDGDVDEGVDG
jgi:hypothetical protein